MLLENKNAVVYGAGGAIGAAVAGAFAREGARVFLAGRTRATLDKVASEISSLGGIAEGRYESPVVSAGGRGHGAQLDDVDADAAVRSVVVEI